MESVRRGDVVGLPAVALSSGRSIGQVEDLLCSGPADRVIGLYLTGGRVVPFEEVAAIGPAAVMLRRAVWLAPEPSQRLHALRAQASRLDGRRILSRDGHDLGAVRDFVFEPTSGRIMGYIVSGGLVHDLLEGQGFLAVGRPMTWGDGVLIVDGPAELRWPGEDEWDR